jgi:amidase
MATFQEYSFMDATSLAELIRKKEIKPIELIEAAIERIEHLNPKLNAIITPMFEMATKEAKGDIPQGPFTGVPILLKDIAAEHAGVRHTEASDFLADYIPSYHSELVDRFKRSGAIIIGVTNAPEFGLFGTTEPRRFGPTCNPWNIQHSTGGSSGGSAAAVSAGLVPIAHANDGGGSIRIPASCCGIFGLKPTRGRNPLGPDYGEFWGGLACEHVVTRSVRDSAAMLDATSGPDRGAPYYAPPPSRPFIQEVGTDPGKLKFGFTVNSPLGTPVHKDCAVAVKETASLLENLGHVVEEINLDNDYEKGMNSWITVVTSSLAWEIDAWSRKIGKEPTKDDFEPATWALLEIGKQHSASSYVDAVGNMHKFTRNFTNNFLQFDMLITPTLAEPPILLGSFDSTEDDPLAGFMRQGPYAPFTAICNMTGQPAMSVPMFWNSDNLPIGVHFMGRYGDESTLFKLASQLEKAKPWAEKKPQV